MTEIDEELGEVLARLRSQNDVLPFMARLLSAAAARMAPLPADMEAALRESQDYEPIRIGEASCRLQIASGNDHAELMVYRAKADGALYVVAP
jgi:hypothetical protein